MWTHGRSATGAITTEVMLHVSAGTFEISARTEDDLRKRNVVAN